ncbi:MAG: mercury(II) reductase [Solirubrobacterales bacterium]|nr:mercury(II) reductase [Solirubrobacterales bacterium]
MVTEETRMSEQHLEISGMTCQACAVHVEAALRAAGAQHASVDWRGGRAVASSAVDAGAVAQSLAGTGYRLERVVRDDERRFEDEDGGSFDFDLIVIGSGGGAFAGAIRARDLGRRVLMVERGTTGGTCVNVGCIPSKALLVASERARLAHAPTLSEALAGKRALVDELRQAKYVDLLDEYGIEFRRASARLVDAHTVAVDGEPVSARAILVASGARPSVPAIPGLEEAGYLTSTSALELSEAPARLAVLGAGAVGLELGQMLGNFGSTVTFIARRDVAPNGEPEISALLREVLAEDGHTVLRGAITTEVAIEGGEKVVRGMGPEGPFELRVDEVLVAAGRTPNTEDLGLDAVGVEVDAHGAIVVDELQRTSVPSIYAAGDVTGQPRFVYVAAAGGAAAAENALASGDRRLDFRALPQIIFTSPAIAQAGLTETEARAQGLDVTTTALPLSAVPRALVNGDTRGLFKLVADAESGRLVGVSVLADGAPDVIQAAVLAIDRGMTAEEIASTWAPYLAMAEGLKLAAQTFRRDVAKLSCCAA